MISRTLRYLSVGLAMGCLAPATARACPFCNAQTKTLSEEIDSSDAVVVAKLIQGPSKEAIAAGNADAQSTFEIVQTIKGAEILGKSRRIAVLYFGQQPSGTSFLVFGVDPKKVQWATPNALSTRAVKYVSQLAKLPKSGPDRLAFFQEHLEDEESLLATDAYDEFARAPYAEVKQLAERMHRDRLLKWIKDREVPASRRRLYLTMLGVCGQPDDIAVLEEMIKSTDRQVRTALDAMVACYLILKGPDGMPLIEELFLKNKDAEYTDTYAAIMAVRFLGQETTAVPKERLLGGLRAMLDRPQLADLVIPDLARWQDWTAMDKLVDLFKNADEESSWVKVPVVNYLRACPKPQAKLYLAELAKLDPESVKRANSFFPFGGAAPAAASGDSKTAKQPLAPVPDKAAGDQPAKASGNRGSKGKGAKSDKPAQPSLTDESVNNVLPVVPALIGAVVAMADETNGAGESDRADETQRENATAVSRATAVEAPAKKFASPTSLDGRIPANRLQVASVTLGATAAVFGLIFTILRGNPR